MSTEPESEDFAAMLAEFGGGRPDPQVGEKAAGTILSIGDDYAFVDLGGKSEGTVATSELLDADGDLTVAVGDRIEGVVVRVDASGVTLRVRSGGGEASRAELRLAWEQKLPVEGRVSAVVKGGVEVTIMGQQAFCPISQLADRFVENPEEFVGERLDFRIQRFEEAGRRTNIVVSRRALLMEEAARQAEKLREHLKVGAVLEGTVSSLTSYGAFVDLGGLEGLLHVSEMSYQRVENPGDLLSVGQRIEVEVRKIEPPKAEGQTERISLSTRTFQHDPWQEAGRRFPVGRVLSGNVMRLEPFGAFVELAPGVEGLVHVSQLGGDERVRHPRDVLQLGQPVQVKVLAVDLDKRRISLAREVAVVDAAEARDVESYRESSSGSEGFGSMASFFKKDASDQQAGD